MLVWPIHSLELGAPFFRCSTSSPPGPLKNGATHPFHLIQTGIQGLIMPVNQKDCLNMQVQSTDVLWCHCCASIVNVNSQLNVRSNNLLYSVVSCPASDRWFCSYDFIDVWFLLMYDCVWCIGLNPVRKSFFPDASPQGIKSSCHFTNCKRVSGCFSHHA
jgi:hypothetical protein